MAYPALPPSINDVAKLCYEISASKGWHDGIDDQRGVHLVVTRLALIHSEVSEALEALRDGDIELRVDSETGKVEGFASEMADVVIRVFDTCVAMGLDIEAAVARKCAYNKTRPHRHGGRAV